MTRSLNSQNTLAASVALAGVVLFSSKSIFAKMVMSHNIHPVTVLYLRMMIALPFIIAIGIFWEIKFKQPMASRKDLLLTVLISILGYYISSVFDFVGLAYIEANIERLIMFLYPTMVIILSTIFLKKPTSLFQVLAIIASYIGLLIAFADKLMFGGSAQFWFGAILVAISAFTYSIFLTVTDSLIKRVGSVRFTSLATLTMCVCIIIHAQATGKAQLLGFESFVYTNCGIMAVFATVIPIYMFNYAINKLGSSHVSLISCLGPVCTLFLSAVMLNEQITVFQIVGTVMIVASILMINLRKASVAVKK